MSAIVTADRPAVSQEVLDPSVFVEMTNCMAAQGAMQMQEAMEQIFAEMERADQAQTKRETILSSRVTQLDARIIALEGQRAEDQLLQREEKLAASQANLLLQEQMERMMALVNQLSTRLNVAENKSAEQAAQLLQQQQQIATLEAHNVTLQKLVQQQAISFDGRLKVSEEANAEALRSACAVNVRVDNTTAKIATVENEVKALKGDNYQYLQYFKGL